MMTQPDIDTLIADLNTAARTPSTDDPAYARGAAALARVHAGTKLIEVPQQYVVYLIEDRVMVKIAHVDGRYVASQYDEQVL
jgi:hypothetical protein